MRQQVSIENLVDGEGRPAGGSVNGTGIAIYWQRGPLREQGSDAPAIPNGAFVEDVIESCRERLEHYQDSPFACAENDEAIAHLDRALAALDRRTQRRTDAGTEGTHQGS